MGGGWRVWAATIGMCQTRQTRQPELAELFAVNDYAVGKVAVVVLAAGVFIA